MERHSGVFIVDFEQVDVSWEGSSVTCVRWLLALMLLSLYMMAKIYQTLFWLLLSALNLIFSEHYQLIHLFWSRISVESAKLLEKVFKITDRSPFGCWWLVTYQYFYKVQWPSG